jgi:hypothetical protein
MLSETRIDWASLTTLEAELQTATGRATPPARPIQSRTSFIELGRYSEAWDCLHNALILDKNYTLARVNAADYYYKVGDMNNYHGALLIIRMQGYNETEPHWTADTQAVMMKDNFTALSSVLPVRTPAAGWPAVVFGLLSVWATHRIRKRMSVA